jgi:hypothetical protein
MKHFIKLINFYFETGTEGEVVIAWSKPRFIMNQYDWDLKIAKQMLLEVSHT